MCFDEIFASTISNRPSEQRVKKSIFWSTLEASPNSQKQKKISRYNFRMVEVKHESRYSGSNLLLAHKAQHVYYLSYPHPSLKNC
jgi:hypothetical protein